MDLHKVYLVVLLLKLGLVVVLMSARFLTKMQICMLLMVVLRL